MFILKIIGIILLALLGLILLAIALVLFVPVRYKISGEIEEEVTIHARVTWLLHLISWRADYQNKEFDTSLRILGILKKDKPKTSFEDLEDEEYEEDRTEDEIPDTKDEIPDTKDEIPDTKDEISGTKDEISGTKDDGNSSNNTVANDKKMAENRLSQPRDFKDSDKLVESKPKQSIFSKIKETILGIKRKLVQIWKMLCQAKDKAVAVKELIDDETNRRVVGMVWAELKYLLRHFKFRKIDTDLRFSLGDPAGTGQALGVLAMLPFLYQYNFKIYPDFESEDTYVKGTFCIQGRVRIVHVLVSAVRLIKQREFRTLMAKQLNR